MFSDKDLSSFLNLTKEQYDIQIINHHDITVSSRLTGHEWIFVSDYSTSGCRILHRHSRRYPFHDQRGTYKTLAEALEYIICHDHHYAESHSN